MAPEVSRAGRAGQLAIALIALALGVFFAVIGFLIIRSPISDAPAWIGWLLRGFVLFVFGSIAAGAVAAAVKIMLPERGPSVPAEVLARCPACGERWGEREVCGCGEPRTVAAQWSEARPEGIGMTLFGGAMGAGIACLGLFIAAFALFGNEEKRILMIVAYCALALLLAGVGGAMAVGCTLAVRDDLRGKKARELRYSAHREGRFVSTIARVEQGGVTLRGTSTRYAAIEEAGAAEIAREALDPRQRTVALVLAALHARGEVSLSWQEVKSFTVLPGEEAPSREVVVDVAVEGAGPRGGAAVDARDRVLAAVADGTVKEIAGALAVLPELSQAFEVFAARLAGQATDPRTIGAIEAVLAAPARSPYRAG